MSNYKPETIAIHGGYRPDGVNNRACAVPIVQSASYVFKDTQHAANLFDLKEFGDIYTRLSNPTVSAWEQRMAELEGGTAAVGTASGMSAIFLAILTLAKAGDHIVSSASLYGGTDTLFRYTLPDVGISCDFVRDASPKAIKAAIKPNTKAIYIESIANPSCLVPDFTAIAEIAHAAGLPLIVDNTFAPLICRPKDLGADIIVHSCTKWVGGHGTTLGGVIIDCGTFNWSNGKFPMFTKADPCYHGVVYWDTFGNLNGANIAFAIRARTQGLR
ncbi:MAG: O-acetylhomoserine aminocarboxypropyltransferase/cysteine synthase, partial [Sedimentisphaerales bacterium]|nr:O-acetylhomoserine aminocarboxypropyltransferase/cysteine synthase [Sedimentisphaerales bacterium]